LSGNEERRNMMRTRCIDVVREEEEEEDDEN
jgi:hypothetical protein